MERHIRKAALRWSVVYILAAVMVLLTIAFHFQLAGTQGTPLIFGHKSVAMLDLWSIQHWMSGILLGSMVLSTLPCLAANRFRFVTVMLICSCGWEVVETIMEAGHMGEVVANWKDGFEHWSNRLLGDPLMVTTGGLVAHRCSEAWRWALIPTLVWFAINVDSPNSMHIQTHIQQFLFGLP